MPFAQSGFAQFMASPAGRVARIVLGVALIAVGASIQSVAGWVIVAVGVLPLTAGAVDVCLFSPLFGGPLAGRDIRALRRRG